MYIVISWEINTLRISISKEFFKIHVNKTVKKNYFVLVYHRNTQMIYKLEWYFINVYIPTVKYVWDFKK